VNAKFWGWEKRGVGSICQITRNLWGGGKTGRKGTGRSGVPIIRGGGEKTLHLDATSSEGPTETGQCQRTDCIAGAKKPEKALKSRRVVREM